MSDLAHRHTIHRDHIHHGWNNAFAPVLKIAPGESVEFETLDASSGQLTRTSTAADLEKLDLGRVNPVTGPVWIDGAMPGDALKVTILSLRPSGWGWTGNIPGFGLLTDQFPNARLHHWNYDPGLAPAMFGPGGRVPLRPFTGTIGVAPGAPGLHSIIPPRNVGGNMDARDIAEGVELYLPVEVEGALFSVGDTHAAQGDGEVCGTAIESPIDVALKFELVKNAHLRSPRYVTPGPVTDHFDRKGYEVTTGIGPDLMPAHAWPSPRWSSCSASATATSLSMPTCCAASAPICASARSSTCRTGWSRSTFRGWCSNRNGRPYGRTDPAPNATTGNAGVEIAAH